MKFSFVIPTYNNKYLLNNTLEALNSQIYPGSGEYEAVVVDDGSTDDTHDYIEGVNKNYSLKYYYLERDKNSCRAKTRNKGWKNASGEIIAFIDSDILVKPDYLYELNRCFSINRDILVLGNRLMLDKPVTPSEVSSGEVFKKFNFDKNKLSLLEYRYFLYETTSYNANMIMLPWTQVYSCNMAVSKKWLESAGGFDENFKSWGVEDIELGYALYEKKVGIVINSKLEVLHQNHGDRNDLIISEDKIAGYDRNLEYFFDKHPDAVKMRKKFAFKFLKGEISDDKMFMDKSVNYIKVDFKNKYELEFIKDIVIKMSTGKKYIPVINDYNEKTDLDIWLQHQSGDDLRRAKYYPMSKRLDRDKMMRFLKIEKERQKQAVSKTIER